MGSVAVHRQQDRPGRPVHLDRVSLNLLPLPGFILENFVVEEDPDTKRPATETSVQLHPNGVEFEVTSQPTANTAPTAPVVSPTNPPATPLRR